MATEQTIELRLAKDDASAGLALLAQAAKRSLQVRHRLVDLFEPGTQPVRVDLDRSTAAATGDCWVRFELSDSLLELVAAVRAGEFDE